jgi:hypothetical protein
LRRAVFPKDKRWGNEDGTLHSQMRRAINGSLGVGGMEYCNFDRLHFKRSVDIQKVSHCRRKIESVFNDILNLSIPHS